MYADLPDSLKKEVEFHLKANNFRVAKAIHDAWMSQQAQSSRSLAPH